MKKASFSAWWRRHWLDALIEALRGEGHRLQGGATDTLEDATRDQEPIIGATVAQNPEPITWSTGKVG